MCLQAGAPARALLLCAHHDSCYCGLLAGLACWHDGVVTHVRRGWSGRHHWQKIWDSQAAIQQGQKLGWEPSNVHRCTCPWFLIHAHSCLHCSVDMVFPSQSPIVHMAFTALCQLSSIVNCLIITPGITCQCSIKVCRSTLVVGALQAMNAVCVKHRKSAVGRVTDNTASVASFFRRCSLSACHVESVASKPSMWKMSAMLLSH